MDFTLKTYCQLLQSLQNAGFSFITFSDYIESYRDSGSPASETMRDEKFDEIGEPSPSTFQLRASSSYTPPVSGLRSPDSPHTPNPTPQTRFVILRHDVDLLPQNSLAFARIQHKMGIKGSYYFRAVPESWDEAIIKEIHALGHEVGYHYEDVDLAGGKTENGKRKTEDPSNFGISNPKPITSNPSLRQAQRPAATEFPFSGLPHTSHPTPHTPHLHRIDAAIISFQHNLEKLRQLVPVKTICMHGSPRSKYDNRDLWKKYNYRDFGIIGEPYFDMDFDDVFYLTDTGRRWDGWKVSVRDKVPQQEQWIEQGLVFGSTGEIVERVRNLERWKLVARSSKVEESGSKVFPSKVMFTFHPQRWTDKPVPWLRELVMQNVKNVVKGALVKIKAKNRQKAEH